jgi:hypothetical protein
MTEKEVYSLKSEDKINHQDYGVCTIHEVVTDFGVVVIPDTMEMCLKLQSDSGTTDLFKKNPSKTPLIETDFDLISKYKR